jgi:Ran GTPase-activating protein (RanGAP) involved in mRNA processing and transport
MKSSEHPYVTRSDPKPVDYELELWLNNRVVEAKGNRMGPDVMKRLLNIFNELKKRNVVIKLEQIDLSGNNFGEEGAQYISEILSAEENGLLHIDLSACALGDVGVGKILDALTNNPNLKTLILSKNRLTFTPDLCTKMLKFLTENTSLTHLDLSQNEANTNFLEHLERGLEKNQTLRVLRLRVCGINSEGAVPISNILIKNKTLESLDLYNNHQIGVGGMEIARGVELNEGIKEMNLDLCNFGEDAILLMAENMCTMGNPTELRKMIIHVTQGANFDPRTKKILEDTRNRYVFQHTRMLEIDT